MTSGFVLGPGEGSAYGAGSFVFVPRDRPQGFTVSGAGPARALVITGPSRLAVQIAGRGEPVTPGVGCDARPGAARRARTLNFDIALL